MKDPSPTPQSIGSNPLTGSPPQSLAERSYFEIRNRMLKGELPVGMELTRRKLAESLKISVPPGRSRSVRGWKRFLAEAEKFKILLEFRKSLAGTIHAHAAAGRNTRSAA